MKYLIYFLTTVSLLGASFTGTETFSFRMLDTEVNVKAPPFNAKGDGMNYDGVAINTAIQYAATNGGRVYIPPGTYLLTNSITMSNNVHVVGASSKNVPTSSSILKLADGADCDIVTFPAGARNSTFRGFYLDGNRTNQTVATLRGIYLANTTGDSDMTAIDDIAIKYVSGYGIENRRREVLIRDIKIDYCTTGYYSRDTADNQIERLRVGWCSGNGIEIINGQNEMLTEPWSFNNTAHGIYINRSGLCAFYSAMTDANGGHGLVLTADNGYYCKNNTFFGGRISACSQGTNDYYSNVYLGGGGTGAYVIDNTFIGTVFWTDVVDMDVSGIWPKYLFEDARTFTGWTPGMRTKLIGCAVNTGTSPLNTKHYATAAFSSGFYEGATVIGNYDYTGLDLEQYFHSDVNIKPGKTLTWDGTYPVDILGDPTGDQVSLGATSLIIGPLTNSPAASFTLRPPDAHGTDSGGNTLNITGGRGTGSAAGGNIRFYTATTGASGTNVNSNVLRATIQSDRLQLGSSVNLSFNDTASVIAGGSSPEGVQSAAVGSLFLNTNGGTNSTLYVKEGGTNGNTGWYAVGGRLTGTATLNGTITANTSYSFDVNVTSAIAGNPATAYVPMNDALATGVLVSATAYTDGKVKVTILNATAGDKTFNCTVTAIVWR